jgi:hypothetical protein
MLYRVALYLALCNRLSPGARYRLSLSDADISTMLI